MEDHRSLSPLRFLLTLPLRYPRRLCAIVALAIVAAILRGGSLAALLPLLKVLLSQEWQDGLSQLADGVPDAFRAHARSVAGFLTTRTALAALLILLGTVIALTLLRAGAQILQELVVARLVHDSVERVAVDMHRAVLRGAGEGLPEGAILTSFTTELDALRICLRRLCGKLLREPLNLVVSLVGLFALDPRLSLWTCALFPLPAFLLLMISRKLRAASRVSLMRTGQMVTLVDEALRGRRVVRSFGLEDREEQRFASIQEDLTRNLVTLDYREASSNPLLEVLGLCAAAGCIVVGADRVFDQSLDPATFMTFYLVLISMLDPLRKLADTQVRVQRAIAAARNLIGLLGSVPPSPPICGDVPFRSVDRELMVDDLCVLAAQVPLLDHVRFRICPGESLLVAGPSGAGKSTLLDVIAGLRHYNRGRVCIDGVDIQQLRAEDFRERVGLVAQETFLFRGTLAENITLSQPPRGIRLELAIDLAELSALLSSLPRGLNTLVEERQFSVGEKQRLSIARALYRDPAILLLDEATSALDRPTEEKILKNVLGERGSQRITLLVTHRLHPEIEVDQVLLLNGGRCVDVGSPVELLSSSDFYRSLVRGGGS